MRAMRLSRLPALCRSHRPWRCAHQLLPTRWRSRHRQAGDPAGSTRPAPRSRTWDRKTAHACAYCRNRLHRLHQMHPGFPGGPHRRLSQMDAYDHSRRLHRLRTMYSRLPGRLHRPGADASGADRPGSCRSGETAFPTPRDASGATTRTARCGTGSTQGRSRHTGRPGQPCAGRTGPRQGKTAGFHIVKRADIVEMFSRLRELDPHPTTELTYTTPFELLVAVVLSAQATDVGVNKATKKLYPVANTPQAILDLGEEKLKQYISTIGLFNSKAKNGR